MSWPPLRLWPRERSVPPLVPDAVLGRRGRRKERLLVEVNFELPGRFPGGKTFSQRVNRWG